MSADTFDWFNSAFGRSDLAVLTVLNQSRRSKDLPLGRVDGEVAMGDHGMVASPGTGGVHRRAARPIPLRRRLRQKAAPERGNSGNREESDVMQEHALRVLDTHSMLVNALDHSILGMTWDEIRAERSRLLLEARNAIADRPQVTTLALTDGQGGSGSWRQKPKGRPPKGRTPPSGSIGPHSVRPIRACSSAVLTSGKTPAV